MEPELDVSTVDAFQGAEKDIIFLSTIRSDNIGFINDKRFIMSKNIL
jgi:superfamily I DNA and/or RNA helicase